MAIENYEPFVRHDVAAALYEFARVYEGRVERLEEARRDGEPIANDIVDHALSSMSLMYEVTRALCNDRLTIIEEENN